YLLDAEAPDDLYCNAGRAIISDRLDFADIFLRYGGVACFLQVNWVTPVKIRSLAVTGTEGYAELEYVTQRLELYRSPRVEDTETFAELEALSETPPERVEFEHVEPLTSELREFVAAARGEPAELVTGEDA